MKILHYINQFFAGIGGEEAADAGPEVREGPVGPGVLLSRSFADSDVKTVVCGDNYAAAHLEELVDYIARVVEAYRPDVLVCGPAFNAGRYGLACGELCVGIPSRTGVPAITGLFEENAAVSLYRSRAVIVRTTKSAAEMRATMERITSLIQRLTAGEELHDYEALGLYSPDARRNRLSTRMAADRAVDMVLQLAAGDEVGTELAVPDFEPLTPPVPVGSLDGVKLALVTEGGLVPRGNPDGLTTGWSERWASYPVADLLSEPAGFEAIHGGYDTRYVNEDPFRLVPADIVTDLVEEGRLGALHPRYFVTCGMATPVENSRKMGAQIAAVLKNEGVQAVLATST